MVRAYLSKKKLSHALLVFFSVLISSGVFFQTTLFAQEQQTNTNNFDNYKYLFASPSYGETALKSDAIAKAVLPDGAAQPVTSGIIYKAPAELKKTDNGKDGVGGFIFGIGVIPNYNFEKTGFEGKSKPTKWFNSRVASVSKDAFVIRVCDVANNSYKSNDVAWESKNCFIKTVTSLRDTVSYTSGLAPSASVPSSVASNIIIDTSAGFSKTPSYTATSGWERYTDTSTSSSNAVFTLAARLRADLWYCAADAPEYNENGVTTKAEYGTKGYTATGGKDFLIKKFGNLCNGASYYRIGAPIEFTTPSTIDALKQEVTSQTASAQSGGAQNLSAEKTVGAAVTERSNLPECTISFGGNSQIVGCFARIVFYGVYTPLSWIAGFFGMMFDFFLGFSTSDESYRYGFVDGAWQTIRDISNIFFIIILVYIGFSTVFGSKNLMKTMVPSLIVNALLINFSLLGTRMVIDLSNIVSRVFYTQIKVCSEKSDSGECTTYNTNGTGGYTPVSEGIVASFNPQKIFENGNLQPPTQEGAEKTDANFSTRGSSGSSNFDSQLSPSEYAGYFIVITIFASGIMVALIKIFWSMGFMFVGRVVGLYVCMIFSPFAVLTRENMPLVGKIENLKWSDWTKELSSYALIAPIFIFFFYLIYGFMQKIGDFVKIRDIAGTTPNFLTAVLSIGVPMVIVYLFIEYGVNIAKKYGGEIGNTIQKKVDGFVGGAGGVIGGAAGLAAGGGALLGSRYLSRGIGSLAKRTGLSEWAEQKSKDNFFARQANNALAWSKTSSWDVRRTKAADLTAKAMEIGGRDGGLKVNDKFTSALATMTKPFASAFGAGNILDLSKERFEGGFKGQQERRIKEQEKKPDERINFKHLSDDESKQAMAKRQSSKAEKKVVDIAVDSMIKDGKPAPAVYTNAKTAVENAKQAVKNTEKVIADDEKELKIKGNSLSKADKEEIQNRINENKNKIKEEKKEAKKEIKNFENVKEELFEKFKKEESALFESSFIEALKKQEKEDKKKYGEVKNSKDLEKVMRDEYRQNLQNSFWLEDGKPKAWLGDSAFANAVMSTVGNRLAFEQETLAAALSKTTLKPTGKRTPIEQIEEKIEAINTLIETKIVEKISGMTKDAVKALSLEEKKDHLSEAILNLEDELDLLKRTGPKRDERKKDKEIKELEKVFDKLEKLQDDLEKKKAVEEAKKDKK